MLRGLYTAAAGMIAEQRKHDTITNNISNLNTPGFKQGNAVSRSFPEMLIALASGGSDSGATRQIGRLNTGVFAEEDLSIYVQGDLQETKNPLDVAVVSDIPLLDPNGVPYRFDGSGKTITPDGVPIFQPQAFITVLDNNGQQRYSRNGRLQANAQGELVTSEGYRVLGIDGQPIVLQDPDTGVFLSEVKISPDGSFVDAVNGRPLTDANGNVRRMLVSRVDNPNRMIREGNGVYRFENPEDPANAAAVTPADGVQLRQGFIERSNVDAAQSMIDMTSALRAYEANQKMVQFYDRSLEKTVNEVGRI